MDVRKFKTKTVFEERNNGSFPDCWCVALDIGYSAVKIFSPNIVAMFPAYAKKETAHYIGEPDGNVILYKDLETGECWTVGEDAQNRIDARDTSDSEMVLYGRERYLTPMFRVLTETGMALGCMPLKNNAPNGRELFIQTGLPPKYLKLDQEMLRDVISGRHHFSITLGAQPPMEFDFTVKEDHIDVIEQPLGTLYSVMMDNRHNLIPGAENYMKKRTIIFDPGFGTLDICSLQTNCIERYETFDDLGMKRVLKETTEAINEKYGQDISVPIMQKYLGRGAFRYQKRENGHLVTKDIAFDDILAEKNRAVCIEAVRRLEQVVPIGECDYLIITGGTSAAWGPTIRQELSTSASTLKIIDGNQNDTLSFVFANVRGYFMYRYHQLRLQQLEKAGK